MPKWYGVEHPTIPGVTTYFKDRAEAQELSDRYYIRYSSRKHVFGVERIPNVLVG